MTSLPCRWPWHLHQRYSQGLRLGDCIFNKREKRSSVSVQRQISCSPFVVFQSRHDDRDCQQASPLYQLCGWRTFANWFVMPAVCSLLQVCRCTVVNSPWGWQPLKKKDILRPEYPWWVRWLWGSRADEPSSAVWLSRHILHYNTSAFRC